MNWYHRVERRYVEYGTSLEATRAFGLFRCLYDTVYNMNMAHLSHEVETVYETPDGRRGQDSRDAVSDLPRPHAATRWASRGCCARSRSPPTSTTPSGGPTSSSTASSTRAAASPASRRLRAPARATSTRPASARSWSRRTSSTSCSSRSPTTTTTPTGRAPRRRSTRSRTPTPASSRSSTAGGGMDAFLEEHAVIVMADHAQTQVDAPARRHRRRWPSDWRVQLPNMERPEASRARRRARRAARRTSTCSPRAVAARAPTRASASACARSTGSTSSRGWRRRRRAGRARGRRRAQGDGSRRWSSAAVASCASGPAATSPTGAATAGTSRATSARARRRGRDGRFDSADYPERARAPLVGARRACTPATSASRSPTGYECVDWGGATHIERRQPRRARRPATRSARCSPSASSRPHGPAPEQWTLRDVARPDPQPLRRRRRRRAEPRRSHEQRRGARAADAQRPRATRRRGRRLGLGDRPARPPRHAQARQLAAAVQVRGRRRLGLRRQPRSSSPLLTAGAGVHHLAAAVGAFCVAVTNNFLWNRHWTFRATEGHAGFQAMRFFVISVAALGVNLSCSSCSSPRSGSPSSRRRRSRSRSRCRSTSSATSCGPSAAAERRRAALRWSPRWRRARSRRCGRGARARPEPSAPGATAPGSRPSEPTCRASPSGFELTAREAIAIAERRPQGRRDARRAGASSRRSPRRSSPTRGRSATRGGRRERAQVIVDDPTGEVKESWTGHQVAWQMARGYEGSFGHLLNAAYVWIPLCAALLLRALRLPPPAQDGSISTCSSCSRSRSRQVFFNDANIGVSVPLAYPPLLYLLARMLWIGFRGRRRGPAARRAPDRSGSRSRRCFLLGFRIALNVADSGVIDVGYAGVIGADRIVHGEPLYGEGAFPDDNPLRRHLRPAQLLRLRPVRAGPAGTATGTSCRPRTRRRIFFDLACVGAALRARPAPARRRAQGRDLGVDPRLRLGRLPVHDLHAAVERQRLARRGADRWAPLLVIASAPARGALAALAGLTKFAPLRARAAARRGAAGGARVARPRDRRRAAVGAAVCARWCLFAARARRGGRGAHAPDRRSTRASRPSSTARSPTRSTATRRSASGARRRASTGFRSSSRSARRGARRPRRLRPAAAHPAPDRGARGGGVIAVQLTADHWFYLYIVWFLPGVLVALSSRADAGRRAAGSHRSALDRAAP